MGETRNDGIDGAKLEWNLRAWARRLHGALAARLALGAAVMAALPGCDSTSFTPPRPTELSTSPSPGQ